MAYGLSRTAEMHLPEGRGLFETCPLVVCLDLKARDLVESIKYIFNCRFANCGLTARCWLLAGDVQSSAEAEHKYCCSVIILTSLLLVVGCLNSENLPPGSNQSRPEYNILVL